MRESDREGRIMIKVIKKDGTKEEFNVQKVVVAVNKSAYRALVTFTEEELDFICNFVTEKVEQMRIVTVNLIVPALSRRIFFSILHKVPT